MQTAWTEEGHATVATTGSDDRPSESLRFDWWMTLLCGWFVAGFYIDAYAHHNGLPETFFTPWHGILYAGFAASAGLVFYTAWRNHGQGHAWRKALPIGYWATFIGALVFLAGGLGDMVWHVVFGIENDVEALFSPTHLLLGVGSLMMASGPLRAAWWRMGGLMERGWRSAGPVVLSLTFIVAMLVFFIQFADPFSELWATDGGGSDSPKAHIYVMNSEGEAQTRLSYGTGADDSAPAVSPDGRLLAFMSDAGEGYGIWTMRSDGSERRLVSVAEGAELYQPAWSPDGAKLAFVRLGEQGDDHDHAHPSDQRDAHLWIMNTDGSDPRPMTNGSREDWRPTWSPDGAWIAFHSEVEGNSDLYRVSTGGGIPERLTQDSAADYDASWSPNGQRLAFATERDGQTAIYTMPAAGGEAERLTAFEEGGAWQPRWSPDGRQIAFNRWLDGDVDVWLMEADGSAVRNLSDRPDSHDGFHSWLPDGSGLVFRSRPDGDGNGSYTSQAAGSMGMLLHAAVLASVLLVAVSRWNLPAGALTVIIGISGAAMAALENQWGMILVAVLGGLAADLLYALLRPSSETAGADDPSGVPTLADFPNRLRGFAFLVPALLFAIYQVWHLIGGNMEWSVHMWTGSFVMAGMVGLLLSFLITGFCGRAPGSRPA